MNDYLGIGLCVFLILVGVGGCNCLSDLGIAAKEKARHTETIYLKDARP